MRSFKDLGEFLQLLETEKQLLRISEEVSLDCGTLALLVCPFAALVWGNTREAAIRPNRHPRIDENRALSRVKKAIGTADTHSQGMTSSF